MLLKFARNLKIAQVFPLIIKSSFTSKRSKSATKNLWQKTCTRVPSQFMFFTLLRQCPGYAYILTTYLRGTIVIQLVIYSATVLLNGFKIFF